MSQINLSIKEEPENSEEILKIEKINEISTRSNVGRIHVLKLEINTKNDKETKEIKSKQFENKITNSADSLVS